jgi:uncharacterized protein (DUF58 family)
MAIGAYIEQWTRPRPVGRDGRLGYRRIYILPTRAGLGFALVLFMMLLGSINYGANLGFLLTFLLAGVGLVSLFHTVRNLARLRVAGGRVQPVFCGQNARFPVCLTLPGDSHPAVVGLSRPGREAVSEEARPGGTLCLELTLPARHRGRLSCRSATLFSEYPLGLFRAWTRVRMDMECLVYPAPAAHGPVPPSTAGGGGQGSRNGVGEDDFAGLRNHHPGDPLRHVAWKAVARGHDLLTKEFAGETGTPLWLDWDKLPGMDGEQRLSVLCHWVLDAHGAGQLFGLRLPGRTVTPGRGEAHMHECLRALALFGDPAVQEAP